MPRVPRYERQIGPTPTPAVRRTPEQYGAGIGEQMGRFAGIAVAGIVDLAEARHREAQDRADRIAMNAATRQLNELEHNVLESPDKGALNLYKGATTANMRGPVLESYDEQVGMIEANLTSENQRIQFASLKNQRRAGVVGRLVEHELKEYALFEKGEAQAAISTAANMFVANADRPARANQELDELNALIELNADVLGLKGPQAIADYKLETKSKMYEAAIGRLITQGNVPAGKQWFEEAKKAEGQLNGAAIASIEAKLADGTAQQEALAATTELWAKLGPTHDDEAIKFDDISTELRLMFKDKGNTKAFDAAMAYHRERYNSVEAGRRQRLSEKQSALWTAITRPEISWATITRMPEYVDAPGPLKAEIGQAYLAEQARIDNARWQAEQRPYQRDAAAFAAAQREREREEQRFAAETGKILANPQTLRNMTEGEVLALRGTVGANNAMTVFTEWRRLQGQSPDDITFDQKMFDNALAGALGNWVLNKTPSQRSTAENSQYSTMWNAAQKAIAEASAGGKKLGNLEKEALIKGLTEQRVYIDNLLFDTVTVATLVNPADRTKAYVLLSDIDANPRVYYQAYAQALKHFRDQPGNARLSDQQLRATYGSRIQRAIGRSFAGASNAEIKAALDGQ